MKHTFFISTAFLMLIVTALPAQNGIDPVKEAQNYITTTSGVRLYAKKAGKGPVCIFVHGGPGAWSKSFEDLGGNKLEEQLSMIYLDQRGCGRSGNPADNDYSLDSMVDDIEQVRQNLGTEKVYILSHSFGGILAVNYAAKYPQHVKGLILANSTLNLLYSVNGQTDYINSLLGTNFTASGPEDVFPTFIEATKQLNEEGLDYKRLSDIEENVEKVDSVDLTSPSTYQFAQNALRIDAYLKDYTTITPNIACPVLIITGKKDHAIGVDHYKAFKFPNQEVVSINGGHILYFENNKAFVDAIFSFVDKTQ
ncbi:alpha/beta fold hydrolase [Galbibacter sp. PAP.153]|uniref:alpha/beta fold hydrolase n=1 Tax=Galbibacter sp. PAP.153 TaxID=3104623 RepID=UPI00300B1274